MQNNIIFKFEKVLIYLFQRSLFHVKFNNIIGNINYFNIGPSDVITLTLTLIK